MKCVTYLPGATIPGGVRYWFVINNGHFVRKVDLKDEFTFPELENKEYIYIAFG